MKKLKTICIIQARIGSSRLPGKILMKAGGRTLLENVLMRVGQAKKIDKIVVATTDQKGDDVTERLCKEIGIDCFRGSENDVLDRFYQAAIRFKADVIVRVTGDCPFHDPILIDNVINFYLENEDKYDYVSNVDPPTFPDGLDLWVFPFGTLERAWKEARLKSEREHVCPYIWKNPHLFRIGHFKSDVDYSHMRWTVDEENDLRFVKEIYKRLHKKGGTFHMQDIISLLEEYPELMNINKEITRDEGLMKSLREDKIIK